MKTVYIPKGETVSYESLVTEHLVVNGFLNVTYGVKAKSISGTGVICAGSVSADTIRIDELEAASVICKRLMAKRVQAPEVFASECAAVSCFLSSAYVETGKLTVAVSEISEVKAEEVVNLPAKKRGLFMTLFLSWLRSVWASITASPVKGEADPVDVPAGDSAENDRDEDNKEENKEDTVMKEEIAKTVRDILEKERTLESEEDDADFELKRIVSMFKLLRKSGYTLRVVPGTPEENAPSFDFENDRILRPAA